MKRRTRWIIGITTTIVTMVSLNAALGSRNRMHNGSCNHHSYMHDKMDGENKTTPSAEPKSDSSTRR